MKIRLPSTRQSHIPPLRGVVDCFSPKSRYRLLCKNNTVDRRKVDPLTVLFVTLTYPGVWPADPREWKRHSNAFRKRLQRAYGRMAIEWKIEPQKRGAPHFHLLIFSAPTGITTGMRLAGRRMRKGRQVTEWTGGGLSLFRKWVSLNWFDIVDSNDWRHEAAGTSVEPVESFNGVLAYAAKYLGKSCCFFRKEDEVRPEHIQADDDDVCRGVAGEPLRIGRYWGIWNEDLLPRSVTMGEIDEGAYVKARRIMRRLDARIEQSPGARWSPRSTTMFIKAGTMARILDHVYPDWRHWHTRRLEPSGIGVADNFIRMGLRMKQDQALRGPPTGEEVMAGVNALYDEYRRKNGYDC